MTGDEVPRLAREFSEALNRSDREGFIAAFHPDCEAHSALTGMEGDEPYRGVEGAAAWFDDLMEAYDRVHARLEQTVVVGAHALHIANLEYVGKGSGVALASPLALVVEVRDRRYIYARSHFDIAEGFLDMGRRLG